MRWQNRAKSVNIEDRRGRPAGGRGRGGAPIGGKARVLMFIVVIVAGYYGIDLTPLVSERENIGGAIQGGNYIPTAEEEEMARFSAVVLKTTEETWEALFRQMNKTYDPTKLVLYTGSTSTTCGYGESAMGPFYCPADTSVYIDLSFYQDMKNMLGGGGDFAQGYVIAHEVGHHVQHLLGISQNVRKLQQKATQKESNRLSVMMELQADCFAGVWGNAMQRENILEAGDVESALRTAEAIGDDRLQKQSTGRVVPDSFTHGTSKQRQMWFERGFNSGNPAMCDTFSAGTDLM